MTNKKFLGFISLFGAVSLFGTTLVYTGASADDPAYTAAKTEFTELFGYNNPLDYINDKDGKTVSASAYSEVKVFKSDSSYAKLDGDDDTENGVTELKNCLSSNGTTLTFPSGGADEAFFLVEFKVGSGDNAVEFKDSDAIRVRAVKQSETMGGLSYVTDATALDAIRTKAQDADNINKNDKKYDIPSDIWDSVESVYFAKKDLSTTVYVSVNGGDFAAQSTRDGEDFGDINLSASGTYRYFVVVTDQSDYENTTFKTGDEDYEYSISDDGAFYVKTNKNDSTDVQKVPVFTFNYEKDEHIKITANGGGENGKKGLIGQRYTALSFDITNATQTTFKLLYSADGTDFTEATDKQAEFNEKAFTATSLTFTPLVAGQFKVRVTATGGVNNEETITGEAGDSKVVFVSEAAEELKLVDQRFENFMKNNWRSIVFLGIAVLCLVGILIIAFWKPKDKKPEQPKAEEKPEETVEAEETTEATEAEEEGEEKPEEEVTEDSEEAEEVPAETEEPVEQTEQAPEAATETSDEATEAETPAEEPEAE